MIHESRQDRFAPHPELKDEERQPCEIWTRVMGYHRPVSSFNRGKQGEFYERQYFSETGRCGKA
ncbi:MAG: anaerobic ribonucleoside-triphosphate reductase [Rhodocyclaceae bacterium]